MEGERNALGRGSGPDSAGEGGHEQEEHLARACASLRLLGDEREPLSLKEAVARGHRVGKDFRRLQQSGAPINEVVVRLSDGGEVTVEKRNIDTDLFMYGFTSALPPDAVLHFYKKADREHGEVLLRTVAVAAIGPKGFTYKKKYHNKQSLNLSVRRGADGLYEVRVEWDRVPEGRSRAASGGRAGLSALLGPLPLAIAGLGRYLAGRLRRDESGEAEPTLAVGLMALVLVCVWGPLNQDYVTLRTPAGAADNHVEPTPRSPSTPQLAMFHDASLSPAGRVGVAPPTASAGSAPAADGAAAGGQPAHDDADQSPGGDGDPACDVTAAQTAAAAAEAGGRAAAERARKPGRRAASQAGGGKAGPTLAAEPAKLPVQIYVKAFAKDDASLEAEMLDSFVKALAEAARFDILTDASGRAIPEDVFEISLDFERQSNCYGTIFVRLYDSSSKQIWDGEEHCQDYPKREMLMRASKELVAQMVSKLDGPQRGD